MNGSKKGYHFKGWSKLAGNNTVSFTDGQIVKNLSNGNNSSGLLLYLIGRRNYPINSIDSNQKTKMIQRKKAAGISLCFMVVGILGLILSISISL